MFDMLNIRYPTFPVARVNAYLLVRCIKANIGLLQIDDATNDYECFFTWGIISFAWELDVL